MFNPKDKMHCSLLAHLEDRAVNQGGRVDQSLISHQEVELAKFWHRAGFIHFGRIASEHANGNGCYWVELTDLSWRASARIRMKRGKSAFAERRFKTVDELKCEA